MKHGMPLTYEVAEESSDAIQALHWIGCRESRAVCQ